MKFDIQIRKKESNDSVLVRESTGRQLAAAMVYAFCGSLFANVLILTFFGIPFAIGWHFGLGWLCLGWTVLGTSSFANRTIAGTLVWVAGLVPVAPVLLYEFGLQELSHKWLIIGTMVIPNYFVFWVYRQIFGSYLHLNTLQPSHSNDPPSSLFGLLSITTFCGLALAAAVPMLHSLSGSGNVELSLLLIVVPVVFLLPLISQVSKTRSPKSITKPMGYSIGFALILALSVFTTVFALVSLEQAFFSALLALLVLFTAGSTVLFGLTLLHDWGYRFTPKRQAPKHN